MLGIIYLFICLGVGWKISESLFSGKGAGEESAIKNKIWLYTAASAGLGILFVGWVTYLAAWAADGFGSRSPLMWGNAAAVVFAAIIVGGQMLWKRKKEVKIEKLMLVTDRKKMIYEMVLFVLLLCFFNFMFFYVFHEIDGRLYAGFTVFGDYAPHTAMMRSFSWENNYPTQYPHYGGEDIKYHFMFQFLVGNLEYLGMRLDVAYNVLSLLVLEGFMMLLYLLVQRIIRSFVAGVLTIVLFLFRSSFSFWIYAWENLKKGTLWEALTENTVFIGYTPNENWGLWNFNVYLNQRHLALGMLLACLAVWIYLDWLEMSLKEEEKGFSWVKKRLFTWQAWKWKRPFTAVFVGVFLGACSFWNGAAVIGALLILFGFAACSDGKLDYLLTALTAVLLSVVQTSVFIDGSAMKASFYWGFVAEDKSIAGVLRYLLIMSGIFFVGMVIPFLMYQWRERVILCTFLLPFVFAFTMSLTPDINVNHKYVMISYAFAAMFWAGFLVHIWKKQMICKGIAIGLFILLTITGVYDFVVIILDNDVQHRVSVDMESNLTEWLSENLEHEDLLLTPQYSMNEVTMSGVMLYSGWPYYAWSAGYDTNFRAERAVEIYTSSDPEYIKKLIKEDEITYIVYEDGMKYEEQECREDVISQVCTLVFTSEDGRIRVYEA